MNSTYDSGAYENPVPTDLDKLHADEVIAALRYQRQIDEDGTECGVSRQAVDEAIALLEGIAEMRRDADIVNVRWETCTKYAKGVEAERDALQRDLDAALADAERMKNALLRYIDPSAPFWKEHDAATVYGSDGLGP